MDALRAYGPQFSPQVQRGLIVSGKMVAVVLTITALAAATFLAFKTMSVSNVQLLLNEHKENFVKVLTKQQGFELGIRQGLLSSLAFSTAAAWYQSLDFQIYNADNHDAFKLYFKKVAIITFITVGLGTFGSGFQGRALIDLNR